MVLVALFILLVSLVLSSIAEHLIPAQEGWIGHATVFTASFVVSTLLFAAIFRVLPDAPVTWRQVWLGAVTTAALFGVGKLVLGVYLERSGIAEGYGKAAGALIALVVWVYYSCIILFIGAEITRRFATREGDSDRREARTLQRRPA
jgi:membrane protein